MGDEAVQNPPSEAGEGGKPLQAAQEAVSKGNQAVTDTRKSILAAGRDALKKVFAPNPAGTPAEDGQKPAETPVAPPKETAAAAPAEPPAPVPASTADVLLQAASQQVAQALQAKLQAEQAAQAAATEAQRLKALAQNPLALLKELGINPDQWQARLANGGEPTTEEKIAQAVDSKLAQFQQRLAAAEQDAAKRVIQTQMPAMLEKDFPLVNARLGVDGAVQAAQEVQRRTGKPVNVEDFFKHMEKTFRTEYNSMHKAQAAPAAPAQKPAKEPPTATNRTTSAITSPKSAPLTREQIRANGRTMVKQLAQAGRL